MDPTLDLLLEPPVIAPVPTPAPVSVPAPTSRKRPASSASPNGTNEDKKAREKKRILRNRELARVSNERRKGRIKAMETDLEETRNTVKTLEESIRALEAENNDLRVLLENKTSSAAGLRP